MKRQPKDATKKGSVALIESAPISLEAIIDYRQRGMTLQEIATLVGCTRQNVSDRLQRANVDGLELYSKHKAQVFEAKQKKILDSITDEKVDNMSAAQAVVAAAIMEDKIRLIRGQATEIIDIRQISLDLESITKRMQETLKSEDVIEVE